MRFIDFLVVFGAIILPIIGVVILFVLPIDRLLGKNKAIGVAYLTLFVPFSYGLVLYIKYMGALLMITK